VTQGALDPLVVRRHLGALRDALAALRRHTRRTSAELRSNTELRWALERGLQLCVQNALDVATHLVAAAGREAPDYATSIDRLAEAEVLPREFAARFRGVAGFRNVLVHGYLEVDLDLVQQALAEWLQEFERFAAFVEDYLERTSTSSGSPGA
jgi:uncharacterized protein YutE (UPF0331/DUF86 family)